MKKMQGNICMAWDCPRGGRYKLGQAGNKIIKSDEVAAIRWAVPVGLPKLGFGSEPIKCYISSPLAQAGGTIRLDVDQKMW